MPIIIFIFSIINIDKFARMVYNINEDYISVKNGTIKMFTAHIDKNDSSRKQTVAEHCLNTAQRAAEYAGKLNLSGTARLQGLLHDMGKLCSDFNSYINGSNDFGRGEIDHAFAGAKYLSEISSQNESGYAKLAAGFVSRTVISHHGLHDWVHENGGSYFDERVSKSERYDEILQNTGEIFCREEIVDLLNASAAEYEVYFRKIKEISVNKTTSKLSPEMFLFYNGLFERLLQSFLIDADRTDTADFMTARSTENSADARKVWSGAGDRLREKYIKFSRKTDAISKRRTLIADKCFEFASRDVGACRLVVPTGGGKTLSSLRFAVEYCRRRGMERILYVAPFMSILEQNSDVIEEIVGRENFLEHYSDFAQSLDSAEELEEYELRAEKWDAPVISTTLVQFLNTIFSDKTASVRRFHRLANSVIIIDEVQAIPLKCVNLFNLAVNFLTKICGCAVVLCTATQPCLDKLEFPVDIDESAEMNRDYKDDFKFFHRTDLISACRQSKYTFEEAADFCAEKFEENGNLLVIVNTKKAAAEIYNLLKNRCKNAEIFHLSTGMCPEHRRDILKNIRGGLKNNRQIVCVTTQLIEAGVDISFKCVVRSLAGLDNAAQAAGRCNRNGEYPVCAAYIINIKDESLRGLREIVQRQDAAKSVILNGEYKNLLDIAAIGEYFERFYNEQKDERSFETEDNGEKTDLVNLLSVNTPRNSHRERKAASPVELIGAQSFKTAGGKFKVIDDNTEEIIVPYNDEAQELISDLNSELSLSETAKKLGKAQRYAVSAYSNWIKQLLENNAVYPLKCGAWALDGRFYDSGGVGLDLNGGDLENLIF